MEVNLGNEDVLIPDCWYVPDKLRTSASNLGSVSTGYSDRPVARAIKIKHAGLNLTGQERNYEKRI